MPNTGHRHRLDLPLGAQTTEQLQADAAELLSWNQKIKALTGYSLEISRRLCDWKQGWLLSGRRSQRACLSAAVKESAL